MGGTGLYLRALTQGLADIPPVAAEERLRAEDHLDKLGEAKFRVELARVDPAAEVRIAANDRQRLIRAFEVHAATGIALTDWQAVRGPALVPGTWRAMVVAPPRQGLYERCDARLDAMVQNGVLKEVAALLERGLPPTLPAMKALGVAAFTDYLAGRASLAQALGRAKTQTRHYAKRQMSWFRTQSPEWERIWGPAETEEVLRMATAALDLRAQTSLT